MTVMEILRAARPTSGDAQRAPTPTRHALIGAATAAVSAFAILVLAVLAWLVAPHSTVSVGQALGVGGGAWLLGQGARIVVGGATVAFTPLLLLGASVWLGSRGAQRVIASVSDDSDDSGEGGGGRSGRGILPARLVRPLGLWTVGYAGCALLVASLTLLSQARPAPWSLPMPVVAVPLAGAAVGLLRSRATSWASATSWLPDAVRRAIRPALWGGGALLGAGSALVALLVLAHLGRVGHVTSELGPGLLGGMLLGLAELAAWPNLGLWGVSWLAGSGVSVVQGASMTWTGSRGGLMPMIPVFGAMPMPGSFPSILVLAILVPLGCGVLIGRRTLRGMARLSSMRAKAIGAVTAAALASAGLGLLDSVGGGSLGGYRLSQMGAPALSMTLFLAVELGIAALLTVVWDHWRLHR